MKQMQTFKFDAELIEALKKKALKENLPFNRMVENHLRKLLKK